jgi:hypothetical protein
MIMPKLSKILITVFGLFLFLFVLSLIELAVYPNNQTEVAIGITAGILSGIFLLVFQQVIADWKSDEKQKRFEENVEHDLQKIKNHLGIANEPEINAGVSSVSSDDGIDKQTKWFNASIFFLSMVVTIAAACAIAVAVLALPSDKIWTGIAIEGLFIVLIIVTGFLTKRWFKL